VNTGVNYYTWSLVGNTTRTYDERALTADHMREKLNAIKRSATSNVDIVRRNEDDDDDDDDDGDDDEDDDDDDDNNIVVTTTSTVPDARGAVVELLLSQRSSPPTEDTNITAPRVFMSRSAKRKRGKPIKRRRIARSSVK